MIPFGHRAEPMVDAYLIETMEGLSFRYTPPQKRGCALAYDRPWENPGSCIHSVLEDDENIKLYYRGYRRDPYQPVSENNFDTACLAVSKDGIHFERAALRQIEFDGSLENNILSALKGHGGDVNVSLGDINAFYDTNPACKPEEKYKLVTVVQDHKGMYKYTLYAYCSADGIHWRKMSDVPVCTKGELDTWPISFWDAHAGLYRCYSRYFDDHGAYSRAWGQGIRAIQSCVSTDFIHWSEPVFNQYEEGIHDHLYTCSAVPMPGAEHVLMCMSMRFWFERIKVRNDTEYHGHPNGVSDAIFMTSRNGVNWDRTIQDAWLTAGPCDHEWTQRNFIVGGGVIERGNDCLFYVNQNYMWDDESLWVYSVPRLRFMGLHADAKGGCFLTKDLHFRSDDICLNYATSAYGHVKVTVLDADGQEMYASEEIYGNEFSHCIHVPGLAAARGRLKIEMKEATLYAIGGHMEKD